MRKIIFIALSLISIVGYGQGIKISALPQAGSLSGSELTAVVQNGVTKKTSVQNIAYLASGGIDSFWALSFGNIHNTNPNNVGIGLDSASFKLDVVGDVNVSSNNFIRFGGGYFAQGNGTSYSELYAPGGADWFVTYNNGVYMANWNGNVLMDGVIGDSVMKYYDYMGIRSLSLYNGGVSVNNLSGFGNSLVGVNNTGRLKLDTATKYAWGLTGNADTNPATNFIGTTDSIPLKLKAQSVINMFTDGGLYLTDYGDNYDYFKVTPAYVRLANIPNIETQTDSFTDIGSATYRFKDVYPTKVYFGTGGQNISQGTFENGTGGNKGISLNCAVGYELNWQGGHLSSSYNNGTTFYPVVIDSGLSVSGTLISTFANGVGTSLIFNGDATTLGGTDSCFMLLGSATGSRITVGQQEQRIVLAANEVKSKTQYFNVNDTTGNLGFEVDFDNNVINNKLPVSIQDGTEGAGKVFTSDSTGLGSWQVTSFTTSDSATIYALTPANGTTYFCSNCSGSGVTGRIVSYFGGLWRRLKFD